MDIPRFQKKVLSFYRLQGRKLPWRSTTDPYKILVSEIMLQQTQVDRVIPFYEHWTMKWPSAEELTAASRTEILEAWMGLGYNNRAIKLQDTARLIAQRFSGNVLEAMHHYDELPGIGPYTSRAVRIFAANENVATVDTNIRRILIHEFQLTNPTDAELWSLAEKCLPPGKSRDWHNALMDYGSQMLTSRKTGISPKTRQPPFEGSDRQIRSRVLRIVLKKGHITMPALAADLSVEKQRLLEILARMKKDQLIVVQKDHITLADD